MITNVISLVVILATTTYSQGFIQGHSQTNNHAYSSQSITMYQNHEEPVYYHREPYKDEFEENDHSVHHNHHLTHQNHRVPDHRHLSIEPTQNNYENNLNLQTDHLNHYNGQPIVVTGGYKGSPLKDYEDHKQMFFKHQNMPFLNVQDEPIRPQYDLPPNPFEHHGMPVHNYHRTPLMIDSHKQRHHHSNHIPRREYEFNYNIEDTLTGDHKAHHETRNDGVVKGVYSFQEADGSIRIVEYTADAKNGFQAKVRHEGQKHKVPKHYKNKKYSHRPRYHPQHNNLHPLLFNSPKF